MINLRLGDRSPFTLGQVDWKNQGLVSHFAPCNLGL
jgi:hypothetical protein